jgi:hypothetical protein
MRCFVLNIPGPSPRKCEFDAAAGVVVDGGHGISKCLANRLGDDERMIERGEQCNALLDAILENGVVSLEHGTHG